MSSPATTFGSNNEIWAPETYPAIATAVEEPVSDPRKPILSQVQATPVAQDKVPTTSWEVPKLRLFLPILLLLVGIGAGVGNHFFLESLNGKPYENVAWTTRYSLALAFVVKTCFAACVVLCFDQVVWLSLRQNKNGTTLNGISSLFTAPSSFFSFCYLEIWLTAPLAAIIAAFVWLLPLIVIVAPTTLSATNAVSYGEEICHVPTLNFSQTIQAAVAYQNSTGGSGLYPQPLTFFTYSGGRSQGPSPTALKLARLTALLGEPVALASPCGTNCTYHLTFTTPLIRCETADPKNKSAPWDSNIADVVSGGITYVLYNATFNEATGTIRIQHRLGASTAGAIDSFSCSPYNVSLTAQFEFLNGQHSSTTTINMDYLNAVDVSGTPTESQLELAAYNSVTLAISSLLEGNIVFDAREGSSYTTEITDAVAFTIPATIRDQDPLAGSRDITLQDDLIPLIEALSLNFTLSMLAYPSLQQYITTPSICATTTFAQVWKYEPANLFISYGAGAIATLFAILVGGIAIINNGVMAGTGFKEIICTTRNKELDDLTRGHCLGASGKELKNLGKVKLRFGVLKRGGESDVSEYDVKDAQQGVGHVAFGLSESVTPIRKYERYT